MTSILGRERRGGGRQRGAATLVVVMVLFFIMAMMAAFANRNLIFEQRIASNYYRAGVALEAADAGTEWALSMLNASNIDAACLPAANSGSSFRDSYLNLSSGTRALNPRQVGMFASCVRTADAQGWRCQCPSNGVLSAPQVADAPGMQPSFGVSLQPEGRAGIVRVLSTGCTGSQVRTCQVDQLASSNQQLSLAVVRIEAALVSALKMPPAMPLTIRQNIDAGPTALGLHNTDPRSAGLLLLTGGAEPLLANERLDSLPGTPGRQALISGDAGLLGATPDAMFKMFFGMSPTQYRDQPAMRVVACAGDCSATLAAEYASGARMIWVDGPVELSANIELGTAARPLLLVANGALTLNGPMRINGLLYARGDIRWSNGAAPQLALLSGAMIGEGSLQVSGTVDLWYQASIIDALSNSTGSFVRVPGSWWDAGGLSK